MQLCIEILFFFWYQTRETIEIGITLSLVIYACYIFHFMILVKLRLHVQVLLAFYTTLLHKRSLKITKGCTCFHWLFQLFCKRLCHFQRTRHTEWMNIEYEEICILTVTVTSFLWKYYAAGRSILFIVQTR